MGDEPALAAEAGQDTGPRAPDEMTEGSADSNEREISYEGSALSRPDPVTELTATISELTAEVRRYQERAAARERIIDKLHAEVEQLRAGEQNLLLRPVTTDLQNLRRDLLHQARTLSDGLSQRQVADLLESFALSAELALERCGSVPIRPDPGTEFSAREHRAVKTVPAGSPQQNERIAAVVSDGYLDVANERVTVPARVHLYRWDASEPVVDQTADEHADVPSDKNDNEGTRTNV